MWRAGIQLLVVGGGGGGLYHYSFVIFQGGRGRHHPTHPATIGKTSILGICCGYSLELYSGKIMDFPFVSYILLILEQ